MKIKAFDYCSRQDFEIPDDLDFDYISVKVITGDEVISFYKTDEPNPPKLVWYHDTSDDRRIDYFDAEYTVLKKDMDEWAKRTDSYDCENYKYFFYNYFFNEN